MNRSPESRHVSVQSALVSPVHADVWHCSFYSVSAPWGDKMLLINLLLVSDPVRSSRNRSRRAKEMMEDVSHSQTLDSVTLRFLYLGLCQMDRKDLRLKGNWAEICGADCSQEKVIFTNCGLARYSKRTSEVFASVPYLQIHAKVLSAFQEQLLIAFPASSCRLGTQRGFPLCLAEVWFNLQPLHTSHPGF